MSSEVFLRITSLGLGLAAVWWVFYAGNPLLMSYLKEKPALRKRDNLRILALLLSINLWLTSMHGKTDPYLTATLPLTVFLLTAAYVDYRVQKLPNKVTLLAGVSLCGGVVISQFINHFPFSRELMLSIVFGMVLWTLPLAVMHYGFKSMGKGDVKLAPVLGGWLGLYGYQAAYTGITYAFILGGVAAVFLLATGRRKLKSVIAFGPFLVAGAYLAWAAAVA